MTRKKLMRLITLAQIPALGWSLAFTLILLVYSIMDFGIGGPIVLFVFLAVCFTSYWFLSMLKNDCNSKIGDFVGDSYHVGYLDKIKKLSQEAIQYTSSEEAFLIYVKGQWKKYKDDEREKEQTALEDSKKYL